MSAIAANTDQSAAFRGASTPEAYGHRMLASGNYRRPDQRVLAEREVAAVRRPAERERHDRGELDVRFDRAEQPPVVVDLGTRVRGEEAVALGQEPLERAELRVERLAVRAVARGEDAARLTETHAFHLLPLVPGLQGHARVEGGHVVDPAHAERGETARGVDAEEPDSRQAVGAANVGADVELQERRDARHRECAAGTQRADAEEHDREPCAAVTLLDLELVRDAPAELRGRHRPVRPERVLPGLAERPAAFGQRVRTVPDAPQRACLPARCPRVVEEVRYNP
jgi:hypothetical protein